MLIKCCDLVSIDFSQEFPFRKLLFTEQSDASQFWHDDSVSLSFEPLNLQSGDSQVGISAFSYHICAEQK